MIPEPGWEFPLRSLRIVGIAKGHVQVRLTRDDPAARLCPGEVVSLNIGVTEEFNMQHAQENAGSALVQFLHQNAKR